MNNMQHLTSLSKRLQQEYITYFHLIQQDQVDNNQKTKSINIIKKLFELINTEITNLKNKLAIVLQLQIEKNKSLQYDMKAEKIQQLIKTAVKTLINDLPCFNISSSTKRHHINYVFPKDLVNFAFRVNKEYSYPADIRNNSSIPPAFLNPFPHEDLEFKSSILKFKLNDQKRLKPPLVMPRPGLVKKGTILKITYNDDIEDKHEIFFKYTLHPDYIPSYFSGELFKESCPIILDKKMHIKLCSCCPGYKDSMIMSYIYDVTSEEIENTEMIKCENQLQQNIVQRPDMKIEGKAYIPVAVSLEEINSPSLTPNEGGTSLYLNSFHQTQTGNGGHIGEDDEI